MEKETRNETLLCVTIEIECRFFYVLKRKKLSEERWTKGKEINQQCERQVPRQKHSLEQIKHNTMAN